MFKLFVLESVDDLSVQYIEGKEEHFKVSWTSSSLTTTFCVDIINEVSSISVASDCGNNLTNFIFRNFDCNIKYKVIVTPVTAMGNGTSLSKVFPGN